MSPGDRCSHPGAGSEWSYCGRPAEKFYVVRYGDGSTALHARCAEHWEKTALPTSPYASEVTADEFQVVLVMES